MEVKKKIKLSKMGYKLLKKKRDALIIELLSSIEKAKNARAELDQEYVKARRKMAMAQATDGIVKIKSAAFARREGPTFSLKKANVMGIEVPHISKTKIQTSMFERGYGIGSTSSSIDEACLRYERVVERIILAAEFETIIKKILVEIEKTKRRVNSLELKTIPELLEVQKRINDRLNEQERERNYLIKKIKNDIK